MGLRRDEAEALTVALADHVIKLEFLYRHRWRKGDIVMWDNCTVQHKAIIDYDLPQRRLMHRLTVAGTVPSSRQDRSKWSARGPAAVRLRRSAREFMTQLRLD